MSSLPEESRPEQELELLKENLARLETRERELLETIRRLEKRSGPEIIRLERLHALEAMSRGVAHNFNNILVGVMGYAQLIEMQSTDPQSVKNAGEIVRCADRARELVRRLNLSVGRPGRHDSEILPLESIIHGVSDATRPKWKDEAEAAGIQITFLTDLDDAAKSLGG
jgi:nitrogen-specific signal transduction histidine kinase